MSVLDVAGLSKTYGDRTLFDHIDFSIATGDRIGLIGVNGTGKSSLLDVIAGRDSAESGEIRHAKAFRLAYLPQTPVFPANVTSIDYIYQGSSPIMQALRRYQQTLSDLADRPEDTGRQQQLIREQQRMDVAGAWEADAAAKTILTRLGVTDFHRPVATLSGGQKKRVALAQALIQPADLLVLDEPTNHLDNETIVWLEETLEQYPGALLMVTHDRYFLNRVTKRIFELNRGRLYLYEGNYEYFLEKKAEREELAGAEETKRQNRLRRELAWLRRGAKARSTKQKARVGRVRRLQSQKGPESLAPVDIDLGSRRLGKKVIEARGLTKAFAGKRVLNGLDLLIVPGERLGIIGPNGSGKTTLLNLFARRMAPDAGRVEIGETVKIGYYTQEHVEMNERLSVADYIRQTARVMRTAGGEPITAEQMLERFLFSRPRQRTLIGKLSGGERRRLQLLHVLMTEPNVLLLDEPTNDLDTETLTVLEDYLLRFSGSVIAVSHDRYFLDKIADHLLCFEGGGKIRRFEGGCSEYLALKIRQRKQQKESAPSVPMRTEPKPRKKKLTYKEQQDWNGIEDRIATLETQVAALKHQAAASGSNAEKVQKVYQQLRAAEQELDRALNRWTELSLKIEALKEQ
ncbi:MAG: ABC-F family ATP-binding cassette domain-containing protein [Sporolactobacillus sp.]|nr:ABC-F family ATP-binding cassette domain-containing protein [Sporolactobacillus sp.]